MVHRFFIIMKFFYVNNKDFFKNSNNNGKKVSSSSNRTFFVFFGLICKSKSFLDWFYLKRLEISRVVPDIDTNSNFLLSNNFELNDVTDWQLNEGLRNTKIINMKLDFFILKVLLEINKHWIKKKVLWRK